MIRYETQQRGSTHVHMVLWLDPREIERVQHEIVACIPAKWDPESKTWIEPTCPLEKALFTHVMTKQQHTCYEGGCLKMGTASTGSPIRRTLGAHTFMHRAGAIGTTDCGTRIATQWPTPVLALLWGGHMNVLRICSESRGFYVLKYSTNAQLEGALNWDGDAAAALGLERLSQQELKAVSAMVLSKPVCATEAAMACLGQSPVEMSAAVVVMDTTPPSMRDQLRSTNPFAVPKKHPVQLYCNRPSPLPGTGFREYFTLYEINKKPKPKLRNIGQDTYGNYV